MLAVKRYPVGVRRVSTSVHTSQNCNVKNLADKLENLARHIDLVKNARCIEQSANWILHLSVGGGEQSLVMPMFFSHRNNFRY